MRTSKWSAAAFVLLLSGAIVGLAGPSVRAADRVTMGSDAEPFALKFFPAEITVPVGGTVRWENKGDLQHDAVAQNGAFKSPLLNKGQTFEFKFTSPGEFPYICTPHEDAGMKGVVKVVGGGGSAPAPAPAPAPPAPPATRAAAAAPEPSTTTTTARPGQPTTTTAARNAAPGPTTTTAAGAADAGVTTSSGPAVTPTSAPDVAGETTVTTAGDGTEESAAGGDHGSGGGSEQNKKTNPLAVAFAGISTVILMGISGKLLTSR